MLRAQGFSGRKRRFGSVQTPLPVPVCAPRNVPEFYVGVTARREITGRQIAATGSRLWWHYPLYLACILPHPRRDSCKLLNRAHKVFHSELRIIRAGRACPAISTPRDISQTAGAGPAWFQ